MASRQFNQFMSGLNVNPVYIEGSFVIGSNGAVTNNSVVGSGVPASSTLAVKQKSTGTYLVQLQDPYYRFLGASFTILPPVSTTLILDGSSSIVVGKTYQIAASSAIASVQPGVTLGSTGTNWYTLGLPANNTPYVGAVFVATSGASQLVGSSAPAVGTGFLQQVNVANIDHVEVLPDVNMNLAPTSTVTYDNGPGQTVTYSGANIWLQTIKSSSGAPINATAGTTIRYNFFLRNSSRAGFNEASSANPN